MKTGDTVLWRRKRRGGARTVQPIEVVVHGLSPAGRAIVTFTRHGREHTAMVELSALEEKRS